MHLTLKTDSLKLRPMVTDDEWAEADRTAEQSAGRPFILTPEDGIRAMEQRIQHLQKQIALTPDLVHPKLVAELDEAQTRRAEYQTQLKGRN